MEPRIAYLSTYPPRRCGIATFTHDLRLAVGAGGWVFALSPGDNDGLLPASDPPEVRAVFSEHEPLDYRRAAVAIDGSGVDVLSLQHEYGIFGGPDGVRVLDLVERLETPIVSTFHTVLRRPSDAQRRVLQEVALRSAASVVMSESAAHLLSDGYGLDRDRIRVVPHGVPDLALVDSATRKPEFDLVDRPTILSFGLIGPGKGYESAIQAMATVRETIPDAVYVILGATHPELVRREGERYRSGLQARVRDLDLADNVRFVDRFVGRSELGRWLQACDVFVTPYPNLDQIVSGTLAYALGAGRAIVSTPYAYARELLAAGRGVLVPPSSPRDMAAALVGVLGDPEWRSSLARRAYGYGRQMTWPTVGVVYRELFTDIATGSESPNRPSRIGVPVHA